MRGYERVIVDPPADANLHGPRCALGRQEILDVRARRRAGARVADIARSYGVSTRTIQRYLRGRGDPRTIVVGRWEADFYDRGTEPPSQVTAWRPSARV